MLVIRLARGGRSKYPVYRIVAAESSRAATGKFVEVLGHYNPHTKDLVIKKEETIKRLNHGAQPSNSVIRLLQQEKIELPSWVKLQTKNRKPKNEPEEAPEEKAAPVAEEAPAEEAEAPVAEASEAAAEPAETKEAPAEEERVAVAATENAAEVEESKEDASEAPAEETTNEDSK